MTPEAARRGAGAEKAKGGLNKGQHQGSEGFGHIGN